jgi:phospholipid/cholesterol/gamma-HCH transport system permease protein
VTAMEMLDRPRRFLMFVGALSQLGGQALRGLVRRPFDGGEVLRQLEAIGYRSVSVVVLTAVFSSMVMTIQFAVQMARFGTREYVGNVVSISLVRELGPVLTALLVGGRVGAGITAELGSMAVTEQVDAIRALGASPVRNLVVPRMIAVLVMLPVLTVIGNCIGVIGGMLISVSELHVGRDFYVNSLLQVLHWNDVTSGIAKSVFFAYFIGIIACYNGLTVTGGADGVGRATTATVVAASITVLVSDFFLTKLFLVT